MTQAPPAPGSTGDIDAALGRLVDQRDAYRADLHRLIFGIDQLDLRITRLLDQRAAAR